MANRDLSPWRAAASTLFDRDPFVNFTLAMDRMLEDYLAPTEPRSFAGRVMSQAGVMPSIEVHETEQAYAVSAELPGIDPKDVQLDLRDNTLTLRGEKRSERKEEDGGRRYSERSFGRFERTIPLAADVDADHIEASFENGVLKVTLPKNTKARDKTRRIEIRGGEQGKSH